jgi:hypothetical protein
MTIVNQYGGTFTENTDRGPTPNIWKSVPYEEIMFQNKGFLFYDDFHHAGSAISSTTFAWDGGSPAMPYKAHGTASTTCKSLRSADDDEIGVLSLDIDADDDEIYLTFDQTYSGAWGKISDTAGDNKELWFEGRIRVTGVADSVASRMFGLREATDAATLDIPNAGETVKVAEFVGFRSVTGDGDGFDAVHIDAAEVVVKEVADDSKLQLATATWIKPAIYFDGTTCHWYINGVEVGTGVLPAATNFPDAEPLIPFFGGRTDSATDSHIDIDWWKFAVLY